jgi:hypothetical protein
MLNLQSGTIFPECLTGISGEFRECGVPFGNVTFLFWEVIMTKEEYPLVSVNLYTHDLDSWRTGNGKYCRILPNGGAITGARIDLVAGLREPTENEIRAACRHDGWQPRGKMVITGVDDASKWVEFRPKELI